LNPSITPDLQSDLASGKQGGIDINFKRVAARALRFWYLIALSLLTSLAIAYLLNRYSTRIYPVTASIIIKENDENVGAKFLYNNELINPYRNFYNELYIMKSYPLLQEVIQSLRFDVSLFREGDLKTTEYYDADFPVEFHVLSSSKKPYGKSFDFTVKNNRTYSLQYQASEGTQEELKTFSSLTFGDTVKINGFVLLASLRKDPTEIKDKIFMVRFNDPLSMAKSYSSRLKADWAEVGASVVTLEVTGAVPQKEIDFLNKFIERYQFYDVEKKNKVATMAIGFLDQQLVLIGDSLNLYEDQVESFKRKNIITNLGEETNRLYQQLQGFEQQKFQSRLLENYFDYIVTLLQSDNYDGIFTPSSVGITDDIIAKLINQLIEARIQVSLYRGSGVPGVDRYEDNPRLKQAELRIQQLKDDILKTIENTRKTRKINLSFINDQIKAVEKQLSRLPTTERELITIQRNYSLRENLYVFLLQKRTEAGLSKASTTSDIMIVNPPLAKGAISPKVSQNYSVAGSLGLLLPLAIFVLIELMNNRIQSKEDIEKVTTVPVIGGIGHNLAENQLIVYKKPRSAMAESFRALRSNLNYFTGNKSHQLFMVTSSIPGEGKSFTCLNLACVFALAGKKTLIIGADLRRPKLFDDLGMHNDLGLSQYLSGMSNRQEIIQTTDIENLFLIAGGPMPPNPSELLLKPLMAQLLAELKKEFDFIIMDTPPLALVTDAFVLSTYADHTLFVIRQDYTPKSALQSLDELYNIGKFKSVSILFNDLRKTGMGYGYGYGYAYGYGYNYGYGYGYGLGKKKNDGGGYYQD
jgi:capsular exopolysaccharide synthesis family protein